MKKTQRKAAIATKGKLLKHFCSAGIHFVTVQPMPSCGIRSAIMERHRQAIREYREAVVLMDELKGLPGFKEVAERAEIARARYLEIREELRLHAEEHGC